MTLTVEPRRAKQGEGGGGLDSSKVFIPETVPFAV